MKKKCLIAVAIAAALASMPVVAGAANSPSYSGGSSDDGGNYGGSSSSSSSSTASGSATEAGTASGTTVNVPSQPTVQVAANGERTSVASTTKDKTGTTIGMVTNTITSTGIPVTSNAKGELVIGSVTVSIAAGAAETAGLPTAVVNTITALNNTGSALSDTLPGLGLEGFSKVGGTRAIVAADAANGGTATAVEVSMTVDTLPAGASTVTVVCYNNATGQWMVIPDVAVDPVTKVVSFTAPGSCTIQIAAK